MTNEELQKVYDTFKSHKAITTEQIYMIGKMTGVIIRLRTELVKIFNLTECPQTGLEKMVHDYARKGLGIGD